MRRPGRVVILNGTSSSGKSTLAERFRDERAELGDCWLVVALDDYIGKLPNEWFFGDGHDGPFSVDGLRFESSAAGLEVRVGELGRRLFAAYRRTAALLAREGFNVLVDDVSFDKEAVRDWHEALAGLRVTWVAVRCDPDVAEAREQARGDRVRGLARGLSSVVHRYATYDYELDTSSADVDHLSAQLATFLR
jgi:chloramphenicol 3-O phosphotransferase